MQCSNNGVFRKSCHLYVCKEVYVADIVEDSHGIPPFKVINYAFLGS